MGKKYHSVLIFLVLVSLLVIIPCQRASSWGAFKGILGIKSAETHQLILQQAYRHLMMDPVMNNNSSFAVPEGGIIGVDDLLKYEGVWLNKTGTVWNTAVTTYGPGPDADGASPYSWHWYNPATGKGNAPFASAMNFHQFISYHLHQSQDKEAACKGLAWSAHFLSDMFVPYHLNGIPSDEAAQRMRSGNFSMEEAESGPLYFSNAVSTGSSSGMIPPAGWGRFSDFRNAYAVYAGARQAAGLDDNNNPIDWFDPWYWNGTVLQSVWSSHASWEANAQSIWEETQTTVMNVTDQPPGYDPLWKNGVPDVQFEGKAGFIQSGMVEEFNRRVAERTKNNFEGIYLSPVRGIKEAITAVYTLFRSACSALQPVFFSMEADPNSPGQMMIKTGIFNHAAEACQNVTIRLSIYQGNVLAYQDSRTLINPIAFADPGSLDWHVPLNPNANWNVFAEVAGVFQQTPDLQYANIYAEYRPEQQSRTDENLPVAPEQGVFGQSQWTPGSLEGNIYFLEEGTSKLPDFSVLTPVGQIYTKTLDVPETEFRNGFPGVTNRFEWFAISYRGVINIGPGEQGDYAFRLTSDDGTKLIIDDKLVIDNDGQHPTRTATGSIILQGGQHTIRIDYFQGPRLHVALKLEVKPPGLNSFYTFSMDDF